MIVTEQAAVEVLVDGAVKLAHGRNNLIREMSVHRGSYLNNMRTSSVRCDSDFRTIASRDLGSRIYDIR